jgi:hypothetical protein
MFINFQNQQKLEKTRYSKSVLIKVLESLETKNGSKIEKLTDAFGESVAVDEVLHLFSDKMTAMRLFSTFEADAKPGPDPYMRDLGDEEKEDKEEQMKNQTEMDDDDPEAYQEMPGDEEAREKGEVKTSKHTKAYDKIYGDDEETNEAMPLTESMWVMPDNYDKSEDLRKDLDKAFARLEKVVGKEYEKFVDTVKNYTTGREAEYGKEAGFDKYQGKDGVRGAIAGMLIRVFDVDPRSGKYSADWMFESSNTVSESVDVDRVLQIELEDGIYYIKPYGDSTHFYISTMKDGIGNGIPAHIGQHRSKPYYNDLRKYLKGGADIDGNNYVGESYVSEGKDDYMARYGKTDIMIKKGYKVADEGDLEDLYVKLGELATELGFGVKNITVVTEGKTTWQDIMEHIESIKEGDEQSDEMAYGQLERCIDYAKMLRDRFDQGSTFDSWMYGKITKAKDYLNTVFDAMDGDDGEIEESVVKEDLKNDIKKYIKKNQKDLDAMSDNDDWDQIYNQLYTDFDVDPDSDEAQELKTVFTVTY